VYSKLDVENLDWRYFVSIDYRAGGKEEKSRAAKVNGRIRLARYPVAVVGRKV
jgi:hypothetical protein